MRRRAGVVAVLGPILLFALATSALAHAEYVKSVPAADARLARAPAEVRVSFSEPPDPKFSQIRVLDPAGTRVDDGTLALVDEATLRTGLKPIGDGGYLVSWKIVSAADGHETAGSFAFAVGDAPLPALPDIPAAAPPNPLDVAGRAVSYAGIALLLGTAVFGLWLDRDPRDDAALRPLERAGGLALLGGTALMVGGQPAGLAVLGGGRLGLLFESRAVLALGAIAPGRRVFTLGLGVVAAFTMTLASHAAATGDPLQIGLDLMHLVAAGTWAGALVALAVVALPRRRVVDEADARDLGALAGRFSTLGLAAIAVIVATGVVQSSARLDDPRDLVETPYGLALLAKILLLAIALAMAALNLLRHGPRLRAGSDPPRAARLLGLGVRGELAAVTGILVAAGLLTTLAPPAAPSTAAYAAVRHDAGLRIQLFVATTQPGENRFTVRLQDGLVPPADVDQVLLRFTMREHDMGVQELTASARTPGEYAADGSPTAMYGTWTIQVIVRRTDRDEARALFDVPVQAPAGATSASAVRAGSLTLIVFTDPTNPGAGKPLTLRVVAVDLAGDPVNADVVAELGGARYAAVPDGSGRAHIDLPAQGAGEKRVTLIVATAAGQESAAYTFTVAP